MNALPELRIRYQDVESLVPHGNNARTHSKHQVRQIAESIRSFGFTNAVLVDGRNTIIAGHGRVAAATLLGLREVPTVCIEHLTEDQIRAYVIADNALATKAGWNSQILAIELQHLLKLDDFNITVTGFEIAEVDGILLEGAGKQDKDDEFELGESEPAVSQPGDLWVLGKHRLLCGNSLQESSFESLMAGRRANLVFTDPPYGVKINGHVSGKGSIKHREFLMASGEMSPGERLAFLKTALQLLAKYSALASIHYVCIDFRHIGELLAAGEPVYGAP